MDAIARLLHLIGAITWLGGMGFMLYALRPVAQAQLQPPARLPLLVQVLARFLVMVWASVALILVSGGYMLSVIGIDQAPLGLHLMLGIGIVMFLLFGWAYFGPFRRVRQAMTRHDSAQAAAQLVRLHPLVLANFALGWIAVAGVVLLR